MKLNIPKDDLNNCRPPPLIFYNPDLTIGKSLLDKSSSLKVDIKTETGERYSKTVAIYITLFNTGIIEALLNFTTLLKKIIRGQDLSTGPQISE